MDEFRTLMEDKNHENKHKSKPTQFTSIAKGVERRLQANLKRCKNTRLTVIDTCRDLSRGSSAVVVNQVLNKAEHRRQQLEKWKEEKERKKKELAAQKKKPFVAGVVHFSQVFMPPPLPKVVPSKSGRVTRSQTERIKSTQSFAPLNALFNPPLAITSAKVPKLQQWGKKNNNTKETVEFEPVLPKKGVMQTRSKVNKPNIQKTVPKATLVCEFECNPNKSTAKKSGKSYKKKSINKSPVPKSESSSEEKLRSPPVSAQKAPMTPEQISECVKHFSPFVTTSRGKDNARREMKKKIENGLFDEDTCEMHNVQYFKQQLDSEMKRMTELCKIWDDILKQTNIPDTVQELILAAVGQTRLLMSAKLQQFARLVERCQCPSVGTALVTPADLHGFWDMVFMQIVNIDLRFNQLEALKARGWAEEQERVAHKADLAKNKKAAPKHTKPTSKPSKLREMIAAARRAKKEEEDANIVSLGSTGGEDKTFEAGFFCVKSPVRSPAAGTPSKQSLLKLVLSNETRKSASKAAPYGILRAAAMHRDVAIEGVEPLQQTPEKETLMNVLPTPGRSILKNTSNNHATNTSVKKIVYFDSSDVEIHNKENENIAEDTNSKPKLERQDAVEERSPVLTRSKRRSRSTPNKLQLDPDMEEVVTPRRSSRRSSRRIDKENDSVKYK